LQSFLDQALFHFEGLRWDSGPPRKSAFAVRKKPIFPICLMFVISDDPATLHTLDRCSATAGPKLNRSPLISGKVAYLHPCLGRTEEDMHATGRKAVSMRQVQPHLWLARQAQAGK